MVGTSHTRPVRLSMCTCRKGDGQTEGVQADSPAASRGDRQRTACRWQVVCLPGRSCRDRSARQRRSVGLVQHLCAQRAAAGTQRRSSRRLRRHSNLSQQSRADEGAARRTSRRDVLHCAAAATGSDGSAAQIAVAKLACRKPALSRATRQRDQRPRRRKRGPRQTRRRAQAPNLARRGPCAAPGLRRRRSASW